MQVNYFKWFDLPEVYSLDSKLLEEKYFALSKKVHPDNFYGKSDFEKQMAEKALGYTHQGYEILVCPVKRAAYILLLNQIDLNSEIIERQPMSAAFLEKMFDWQMQDKNQNLKIELQQSLQLRLTQVSELLSNNQIDLAVMPIREMMFIQKVLEQY